MKLSSEELSGLFHRFERSAFRMEVHPTYTMRAEADTLRRFLDGGDKPADFNTSWVSTVRDNVAAGRTMQRLKVVRRPFSEYTRYLFAWAIPDNVAAGEDYRILEARERRPEIPDQDFWIFDDSAVALLNFHPDGTLKDRELVDPPESGKYLELRDRALREAVAFSEYRAW